MKKKTLLRMIVLAVTMVLLPSNAKPYTQLADGVYQDGTSLFIGSDVTTLPDLQVNPSAIYCYALLPPACASNTFTGYGATLHVPSSSMVSYFSAQYWNSFGNLIADAVEVQSVKITNSPDTLIIGQTMSLSATILPSDATPNVASWSSTNTAVATVSGGNVKAVGVGECDIEAFCGGKIGVRHVTVMPEKVTVTLNRHKVQLMPNRMIDINVSCSPAATALSVASSDMSVAVPRIVNGSVQVLAVGEGSATITVGPANGWGASDECEVTVYTQIGDVNRDGSVTIGDVTALINYLLSGDERSVNTYNADTNRDGKSSIGDVTTLINYLLSGSWSWDEVLQKENFTVNGVSFAMIPVEGGTFTMGATREQESQALDCEKPVHEVTLSNYYIAQTEVTQELWTAVMGNNPSKITGASNLPVERVSWFDCQEFILKLNRLTGKSFRLPTEAEWEYAARGGNKSKGYIYSGGNNVRNVAWFAENDDNTTHPVMTKAPNELGIYDMSGNVWEWCVDWYGDYNQDTQINPIGPFDGSYRISRGGSWMNDNSYCRVSYRRILTQDNIDGVRGMRLALDEDLSPKFRLSEPVITLKVGEQLPVEILNGRGTYTVTENKKFTSCAVNGNKLMVTGTKVGTTTIHLTDAFTGETAVVTVIVSHPDQEFEVNGVSFKMIAVQGGTFTMGANNDDMEARENERPAHLVTVPDYSIGMTEVTQALWKAVMGNNPSSFIGDLILPVENVSWNDCQNFIAKLNELTGKTFRLPTEAEWEYAARGGYKSSGCKYAGSNDIHNVAWYENDADNMTHPVALKAPNELGLYDMSGNVWEWCQDRYNENYYSISPLTNPMGPNNGSNRVLRGGSWYNGPVCSRVTFRSNTSPSNTLTRIGLRLAL